MDSCRSYQFRREERSNMTIVSAERAKEGYLLGKDEGEALLAARDARGRQDQRRRHRRRVRADRGHPSGPARARPGTCIPTRTSGSTSSRASSPSTSATGDSRSRRARSRSDLRACPTRSIGETEGAKALIGFQPFHFEGFLHEVGEPAAERVLPPPLEGRRTWLGCSRSPPGTGWRSSAPQARRPGHA